MHRADRVVMFTFEDGHRLDAWFFGARSNVVLLNQDGEILDAFKRRSDLLGTRPEYRTEEPRLDFDVLRNSLRASAEHSVQTLMKAAMPMLGGTLVREVLFRAGIPSTALASHLAEEHLQALQRSLATVVADLETPGPRVYLRASGEERGAPAAFSLIPLKHLRAQGSEVREEHFDDVHDAIARYVAAHHASTALLHARQRLIERLKSRIAKLQRSIEAIEVELNASSRAEEYHRYGTLLMSNLHLLTPGVAEARVEHDGTAAVIPLDRRLTPVQNAQRFFEKARQARTRRSAAAQRLATLRDELESCHRLSEHISTIHSHDELKQLMREHKDDLHKLGLDVHGDKQQRLPFRIFTVDGGFEVWAGKSSSNNDELTFKNAKPNDLWFHARGASGSHVVLKVHSAKGEPSKKAKEQAAAIAAYYSKMRNAKMVPVAMTERKYVRKPKGAPPGTVLVEREKVIFVEPALPHEER